MLTFIFVVLLLFVYGFPYFSLIRINELILKLVSLQHTET